MHENFIVEYVQCWNVETINNKGIICASIKLLKRLKEFEATAILKKNVTILLHL